MFSITTQTSSVQDKAWPLSLAAGSLLSVGNELLRRGDHDGAMAAFDAVHSVLAAPRTTDTWAFASKQIELGTKSIQYASAPGSSSFELSSAQQVPPDLYEEDECDVGPRILKTPVAADANAFQNMAVLEAILLFNKALVYHSKGNVSEAKQLYQAVICTVQHIIVYTIGAPSNTLLEVAMRSHNNFGLISYLEHNEKAAATSFEASKEFAQRLAPQTKAYRLEYATTISNWCRVSWMCGDISDYLYKALKEVLSIRAQSLSWDHPDVAAARYNLAVAEYARQDSQAAVSHLMQYLAISNHRSKEQDLDDLDAIPAVIFLLLIQNENKDDHMSLELVRGLRSLQDKRRDEGPDSLEVASVLNYVGTLLFHKQDFENALVFFQEELRLEDINESKLLDESTHARNTGETTPVSVTCNNIGRILQELGRFHEAIEYYGRALEVEYGDVTDLLVATKTGSKVRPAVKCANAGRPSSDSVCQSSSANLYSTVWYNLGLIHDKLGAYEEAIIAFEMSLELRKILLGSNHPDIACLVYNIGVLHMEQQRLNDASDSFRDALRIRRFGAAGQLNDTHIVKTLEKLASLHKAKGNIKSALEVSQEVLAIQEASTEYNSISRMKEMGATLRSVSELHHEDGDLTAAAHMAMDSVNKLRIIADFSTKQQQANKDSNMEHKLVLERVSNAEQLVSSLLLLGSLYHEMNEPIQAETILREASTIVQHAAAATSNCQTMSISTSLCVLREVTIMLASCHCAPEA